MSDPVDLTNLRAMIDNDREMEKELCAEFQRATEASLALLAQSTGDSARDVWYQQAHALKGMALNLGANALGEIARKAQDASAGSASEKQRMLADLGEEYEAIREFLKRV